MAGLFDDIAGGPTPAASPGLFDDIPGQGQLTPIVPQKSIANEQRDLARGFVQGLKDIPVGGMQLGAHLAEPFGVNPQNTDAWVKAQEDAYNKGYASGHAPSLDLGRLGGNAVATAPIAYAMPGAGSESFMTRLVSGAGSGALSGALQPTAPGDFWTNKIKQAFEGAAGGASGAGIAGGAGGAIAGNTRPEVQTLMQAGVRPTPGQMSGGGINALEERVAGFPFVGDVVANARRGAVEDLNKAAANRALEHIGEKTDAAAGRELIDETHGKISSAYDRLLPKLTFAGDSTFTTNLSNIIRNSNLVPDRQQQLFKTLQDQLGKLGANPDGKTYKEVESEIGRLARDYKGDPSVDARNLGKALDKVQTELKSALERSNPQYAPDLKKINAAYGDYMRVQNAAGRVGGEPGVFSPAKLSGAVRQLDPSLNKGSFARGQARMQDLSDAAVKVLGNKVPDSGTAGRSLVSTLALMAAGGSHKLPIIGHHVPAAVLPMVGTGLAGMSLYTNPGRSAMAHLLASRPAAAAPIASVVRRAGPLAGTDLAALLAGQGVQ